jgi:hypothetical protein
MLAMLFSLAIIALAAPAAGAALDCRAATPLPADRTTTAPTPDIPADIARFAGGWTGAWIDASGKEAQCNALVVEEVFANGYARVVYSIGSSESLGIGIPTFFRSTGRIADGVLRFRLPVPGRPALAYRFDTEQLVGTFNDAGRVTLSRAPDLAALDCSRANRAAVSPPVGVRDRLTAAELLAPAGQSAVPIHNDYFMPIGASAPAKHALRGTLTIPPFTATVTRLGCAARPQQVPGFSVAFFTHGEHLVPAVRDIVPGALVIFSPGRVWSEPGDGGMSRASFPFAVVNEVNNGTHNALATFVFDDTRVSALAVQTGQETAPWAKVDYAGRLPMTYAPGPIGNETALRQDFAAELFRQIPMRPWTALGTSAALAGFDGDAAPEDISANGLVMDGVLYVRGCHTRNGPFPYCREMRHGVFSVTKSLGAAVALLRLAQKYGDPVFDEKLTDYLPAGMAHAGWQDVTFGDALDMATGIGDEKPVRQPNDPFADENRPKMNGFLLKRTAKEKLEVALSYGKYPWNRGEVLRYNSTQTFVLAWAMDAYLKRREGPGVQLWDMVRTEVFRPIGVFHAPKMHTLEPDGSRGVPQLGYGLYPTVDDVAKLTILLQNGGRHDGVQLLSATKLAEALYRTSPTVGLPLGWSNRYGAARYHLSFWSVAYRTGTGCAFQIPYMTGFGGNLVALLPNGISVFRFADGYDFDVDSMIVAGESLRPFCASPATAAAPAPGPVALTSAEITASFVGHAYMLGPQRLVFAPGGRLYSSTPEEVDIGTWSIAPDARVCRRWNTSDGGRERCYAIYRQGDDAWELDNPDRFSRLTLRRAPGQ